MRKNDDGESTINEYIQVWLEADRRLWEVIDKSDANIREYQKKRDESVRNDNGGNRAKTSERDRTTEPERHS